MPTLLIYAIVTLRSLGFVCTRPPLDAAPPLIPDLCPPPSARHLLSLDGRDERQLWADKLNETLANIRAWDPDAMQPHLDPSA